MREVQKKYFGFPYSSNAGKKAESLNLRHPALSQTESPSQRSRRPPVQRKVAIHSWIMTSYSTTFARAIQSRRRIYPAIDALPPFHCTVKPRSTTIKYLFTRANGRLLGGGRRLVTRAARDMEAGSKYEDGYDGWCSLLIGTPFVYSSCRGILSSIPLPVYDCCDSHWNFLDLITTIRTQHQSIVSPLGNTGCVPSLPSHLLFSHSHPQHMLFRTL